MSPCSIMAASSPLTDIDNLEPSLFSPPALVLDEDFMPAAADNFTFDTIKQEDEAPAGLVGSLFEEEETFMQANQVNLIEQDGVGRDVSMEEGEVGGLDEDGSSVAFYDEMRELIGQMKMPRSWAGGREEWMRLQELMIRNMENNLDHSEEYGAWLQIMASYAEELRVSMGNFQRALVIQADRHAGASRTL